MFKGRLAVCTFVFNRPQYLKRMLRSMVGQSWLEDTDFHFYCDGAVNAFSGRRWAHDNDVLTARALCQNSGLPNLHMVQQPKNVGTGIQQYNAYEDLSEEYQYVVFLDDDVLLSPHWLRTCRILVDWLKKDDSLFFATPSITRACEAKDIQDKLDKVMYIGHGWTAYVADMEKWPLFRTTYLDYYRAAAGWDYRLRPHEAIRALHRVHGYPHPNSSQDAWKEASMRKAGLKKLRTVVNRGFYIGEVGVHATAANYVQDKWTEHRPWSFSEDAERTKFKLYEGPHWSIQTGSQVQ